MRINFEPTRFLHIPSIDTGNIGECICKCPKYYYNQSDSKNRPQVRITAIEPFNASAVPVNGYALQRVATPEDNPTSADFTHNGVNYPNLTVVLGGTGSGELVLDTVAHTLRTPGADPFNVADGNPMTPGTIVPFGANAIILGTIQCPDGNPFPNGILANSYVSSQQVVYSDIGSNPHYFTDCQCVLAGDEANKQAYIILQPNNPGVTEFPIDFNLFISVNILYNYQFTPASYDYNAVFVNPIPNLSTYEASLNYATSVSTETTAQTNLVGDGVTTSFLLLTRDDSNDPIENGWTPTPNITQVLNISPGVTQGMAYTFEKPTLPIGLATRRTLSAPSDKEFITFDFSPFADQSTYRDMIEALTIAFAQANANETGIYLAGETIFVDFERDNWRSYFENKFKMIGELLADPLQPAETSQDLAQLSALVRNAWENSLDATEKHTSLVVNRMFNNVVQFGNLNNFMPPGFYIIPPAFDDYYTDSLTTYLAASEDQYPILLCMELIP